MGEENKNEGKSENTLTPPKFDFGSWVTLNNRNADVIYPVMIVATRDLLSNGITYDLKTGKSTPSLLRWWKYTCHWFDNERHLQEAMFYEHELIGCSK